MASKMAARYRYAYRLQQSAFQPRKIETNYFTMYVGYGNI